MKKGKITTIIVSSGIFLALILIILIAIAVAIGDRVALVEISGAIYSSQGVIEQLRRCEADPSVKAIVLRVNSPGGAVAPVQEIYNAINRIQKKVVVSMGATAASGGYYIACAGDRIFANPGTLTGSIGVIMQFRKWGELMKKIGVQSEVIKSGKYKDAGSPFRELTPEEQELFQDVIDDVHQQFLEAIMESRQDAELTREQMEEIADGRIMSGRQALERKLIDQLGDLNDAIEYAGQLAGIKGRPRVVKMEIRRSLLDRMTRGILGNKLDQITHDQAALRYELPL
jgi:protease-4